MREFLSKSIAGGLSAGVVLLWWPVLFEDVDTVTSWFVRGVAWTLLFELLLLALIPFSGRPRTASASHAGWGARARVSTPARTGAAWAG